jgi:hypothetical protein
LHPVPGDVSLSLLNLPKERRSNFDLLGMLNRFEELGEGILSASLSKET